MAKIKIFSVSKDQKFLFCENPKLKEQIEELRKNNVEVDLHLLPNNSVPLTKIYNNCLKNLRTDEASKNVDIAMFIHSDVAFDLMSVVSHVLARSNDYDLMGFAGTKKAKVSQKPFTWFTGSIPYPKERYGRVAMQNPPQESFFNDHHPDVKDTRVAMIDGLAMIMTRKLIDSNLNFDEQFGFDFYDSDFCISCLKNNFRIGVLVEPVYHQSRGDSVLSKQFLETNKLFAKKWEIDKENKS